MSPAAAAPAVATLKGNSITIPVAEAWSGKHERSGLHHTLLVLEHGWVVQMVTYLDDPRRGIALYPSFDMALSQIFGVALPSDSADREETKKLTELKASLKREDAVRETLNRKGGFVVGVETGDPRVLKKVLTAAGLAARHQIQHNLKLTNDGGAQIPPCRAFDELGAAAVYSLLHGEDKLDAAKTTAAAVFYHTYCCLFEWQFRRTCLDAGGEKSFTVAAFR